MHRCRKLIYAFLIFCFIENFALGFDFKKYNPFQKKVVEEKQKMVETKEQWEIEAQNIPLSERKIETKENKIDTKKYNIPKINYRFDRYNYPQGKRELNIEDIKKKLVSYPYVVADNNCEYIAYPRYYFSPDLNQISSEFYVEKLDTTKSKKKRILEYKHNQEDRVPIIQAGIFDNYPNLYQGLTLVDWSKDSKKLLVKEKVGSRINGIYKTYLYVHFLADGVKNSKTEKLLDIDEAIRYYFLDYENTQIAKYRYDIVPLGFSYENDDIIIFYCYVYDKNNKKIFLGTWGYNVVENQAILYSKDDIKPEVTINGLILKETLE